MKEIFGARKLRGKPASRRAYLNAVPIPGGNVDEFIAGEYLAPASGGYALTAKGIYTGAPTTGKPTITVAVIIALTAKGIYTGAPTTGKPAIGQVHILTATGIKTGAPTTGKPSIAQVHALTALGIVTGAPTTGIPALTVPPSLVALGIYVAPIVGKPAFTSPLSLVARGVTVTPIMAKAYMPRIGVTFGQSIQGRAWVSHTEAYILQGGQWRALQELKIDAGRAWHDVVN